jgi:hypothetical protein
MTVVDVMMPLLPEAGIGGAYPPGGDGVGKTVVVGTTYEYVTFPG